MLLTLSAIWGSSFMFIKVGVRGARAGDARHGASRARGADAARLRGVAGIARRRGLAGQASTTAPSCSSALLNSVVPFWLLAWGETRIDSGLAALLQAGAPLFTAVLAALLRPFGADGGRAARGRADRLRRRRAPRRRGAERQRARCARGGAHRPLLRRLVARGRPPPARGAGRHDRARDDGDRVRRSCSRSGSRRRRRACRAGR